MPDSSPSKAIFLNYRRDDTGGEAGRLFDDLTREFGSDKVFMDVAGIQPGLDFRKAIDSNVASCGVLLAIIGPQWSSMTNHAGLRRLDDPNDFVRLEIAAALTRDIPVIPVLVHGAAMPPPEALPEPLRELAYRNGVELSLARWRSDVGLLLPALKTYVQPTVVTQISSKPDPIIRHWPKIAGAVMAVIVSVFFLIRHKTQPIQTPLQSAITTPAADPKKANISPSQPLVTGSPPSSTSSSPVPSKTVHSNGKEVPNQPAVGMAGKSNGAVPVPAPIVKAEIPPAAAHPLSPSSRAVPYQVSIPFNLNAIYADGTKFKSKASMDGVGDAYHPFLKLADPITGNLTVRGITFRTGPVNDLDALHSSRSRSVTVDLPGERYSTLALLGAAVHQSQPAQTLTIGYGGPLPTFQTVTQGFSDWSAAPQPRFPGEEVAIVNTYRNTSEGVPQPGNFAVYLYRIPLDSSKPLASFTLPKNDTVVILAITLTP